MKGTVKSMKKLISTGLIFTFALIILSACSFLPHEHTPGEWVYSDTEHWRLPECDIPGHAVEDEVYDFGKHIDEDSDHACDVCGYEMTQGEVNN